MAIPLVSIVLDFSMCRQGCWQKVDGAFDQEALTRLIVRRLPDSIKLIAIEASPILFRLIAKAGQIPFVDCSDSTTQGLNSSASLLRGISVYLPKRNVLSHGGELESYWVLSREWSQVDYLKQIFLGLANANSSSPSTREPDRGIYPGIHSKDAMYWLDVSAEAPEMTTLLDALSATPPGGRHTSIPRAQYKPIAESLVKNRSPINSLKIRKTDWLAFVKLMLALQSSGNPDKIDSAVNDILKDFASDNTEEIDWATWIEVMTKSYVSSRRLIKFNSNKVSSPIY